MTHTSVNVNNFKHFTIDENNSLCFGKLLVNVENTETLQIEGNLHTDSHIVLVDSKSDNNLKKLILTAPLNNKYSVTVYDYTSTIVTKYLKDRSNNEPGTVINKLSKIKLLSQINLPTVRDTEQIYLVLDNYQALNEITMIESEEILIQKDFDKFIKNNININFKEQVNVFITLDIFNKINKYKNLETIFKNVYVYDKCLDALVEHLMGKIINCSDRNYQEQLNIVEDVNISSVLISSKNNNSLIGRNNGILQLNTINETISFDFIFILDTKDKLSQITLKFKEFVIGTSVPLDKSDSSISFDDILALKNNYDFSNLLRKSNREERKEIILSNSLNVIKYLLTNDVNDDKYLGDNLELVYLSNLDYIRYIKNILKDEITSSNYNYNNILQFGIPYHDDKQYANLLPLNRATSMALNS